MKEEESFNSLLDIITFRPSQTIIEMNIVEQAFKPTQYLNTYNLWLQNLSLCLNLNIDFWILCHQRRYLKQSSKEYRRQKPGSWIPRKHVEEKFSLKTFQIYLIEQSFLLWIQLNCL